MNLLWILSGVGAALLLSDAALLLCREMEPLKESKIILEMGGGWMQGVATGGGMPQDQHERVASHLELTAPPRAHIERFDGAVCFGGDVTRVEGSCAASFIAERDCWCDCSSCLSTPVSTRPGIPPLLAQDPVNQDPIDSSLVIKFNFKSRLLLSPLMLRNLKLDEH